MDKLMCVAVYLYACQFRTSAYVLSTGYVLCLTRPMSWRRATGECLGAGGTPFSVHTNPGANIAIKPSVSVWTADVLTLHTDAHKRPDLCEYRNVTDSKTVDGVRDCNDTINYLCCNSVVDYCTTSNVKAYNGTREEAKNCTKKIRASVPSGLYWLTDSYDILSITPEHLLKTTSEKYCGSFAAEITYAACKTELAGLCIFSYFDAPHIPSNVFDDSCFNVSTSSLTPTTSYPSTSRKSSKRTTISTTSKPTTMKTSVFSSISNSITTSHATPFVTGNDSCSGTRNGSQTNTPATTEGKTTTEMSNRTQHPNNSKSNSSNDKDASTSYAKDVVVIVIPIVAVLFVLSGVGIVVFFFRRRMNGKKADTNTTACPTVRHNETYELGRPSQETAIVSRNQSSRTATDYEEVDQENKYFELDLKSDAYSYSDEREDAGNYYNINQSTRPEEPVYDHTLTSHTKHTPGLHHDHGENEYNTFAYSKEVDFVGDSAIYDSTDQKQMKTNQVTENVYNTLQTDTAEGMYNSTSDWKQGTKAQNATYDSVTH